MTHKFWKRSWKQLVPKQAISKSKHSSSQAGKLKIRRWCEQEKGVGRAVFPFLLCPCHVLIFLHAHSQMLSIVATNLKSKDAWINSSRNTFPFRGKSWELFCSWGKQTNLESEQTDALEEKGNQISNSPIHNKAKACDVPLAPKTKNKEKDEWKANAEEE